MNSCRVSRQALVWSTVASALLLAGPLAFAGQIGSGKAGKAATNGQIGSGIAALKSAGRDLIVVGAIESVDYGAGTISVVGQTVRVGDTAAFARMAANRVPVAVYGKPSAAGAIKVRKIVVAGSEYVDGASEVYLKGVVSAVNSARGTAKIGTATVDFTAALYSLNAADMQVGSIVELVGTRPMARGSVIAGAVKPLGQIGSGVDGQIGSGVDGQIGSGIDGQIGSGIDGQIGSGIDGQIGSGIDGQIGSGVNGQIGSGVNGQIGSGIDGQIGSGVNGQIGSGVNGQIGSGIDGQIGSGVDGQIGSGVNGQIGSGVDGQIGSGVNGQIGSGIDGQIGSGVNGQIGSGVDGQIGSGRS